MKKASIIISVLTMLMLVVLVAPAVSAQPTIHITPKRGLFVGTGYVADADSYFQVAGGVREGYWHGSGRWVDEDWPGGTLVAVFTVEYGDLMESTDPGTIKYIWFLYGQARVYVNGQYMGTYYSAMQLADSAYVNSPALPEGQEWVVFALYENHAYWPVGPFYYNTQETPWVTTGRVKTWFTV